MHNRESDLVSMTWRECRTVMSSPPNFRKLYQYLQRPFPWIENSNTAKIVITSVEKYFRFLVSLRSIIDLCIILPYWISYSLGTNAGSSSLLCSVLRFFQIFNLVPKKRETLNQIYVMISLTVLKSLPAIFSMGVVALAMVIFFGGILYQLDVSTWLLLYDCISSSLRMNMICILCCYISYVYNSILYH